MQPSQCPALFISAPGSNHGKTTVTAALARWHARQGRRVAVFKTGPDFLDPMILQHASGSEVQQLDLWLAGPDACRQAVHAAAQDADLILIEGVMGMFDGQPCSADLAQLLGIPVVAVIDATGTAQTFGAIAAGLSGYRSGLPLAGVFANSVASQRHEAMLMQGMPPTVAYLGGLQRSAQFSLPHRHLGLAQPDAVADLERRLDAAAEGIAGSMLAQLPDVVEFRSAPVEPVARLLDGVRVGVARDAAFSFLYPANLALLHAMGAECRFFSPLTDTSLPAVDAVYLPGGYPELHLARLQQNTAMKTALRAHVAQAKPIYAECGGMLYLLEWLSDRDGQRAAMAGLLPGEARMHTRLQGLGYQTAPTPHGALRAHTFHYSTSNLPLAPIGFGERLHASSAGEAIYRLGPVVASYLHCWFPSNPFAAAQLFLP